MKELGLELHCMFGQKDSISTPIAKMGEERKRVTESKKVWTTLITNTNYLAGLLTLDHSLKKSGSKYPLVALYTDTFPAEGHAALDARSIPKQRIEYLLPTKGKDYSADPRFYDCWSKLAPFSLVEYERVVQLDSDMLVRRNMDELMEMELDGPELAGEGKRVFAAGHACVCNPLKKKHYPADSDPRKLRVHIPALHPRHRPNNRPRPSSRPPRLHERRSPSREPVYRRLQPNSRLHGIRRLKHGFRRPEPPLRPLQREMGSIAVCL
ncbi:related to galactinol synthase [Phialocephala subalpina]|uniref:Related to galactinol synthase n=1 Tax=Phialocephala subalpina TaxID=576137 RepID=A0A1L7WK02_9HELO|nr:related to galactinol synthase [Phialocephala subalpina]